MSVFHFKQFDVINEASSMKVNTDGVLLGAAATISAADRLVLDAGTGTGTIAIMLAQRYSSLASPSDDLHITGIDIDAPSAEEAAQNFASSPWPFQLTAVKSALDDYRPSGELDLIVSNPPFFEDSLLPPEMRRGMARHSAGEAMSYSDLVDYASSHLSREGRLSMILPSDRKKTVIRHAASVGLLPFRIMHIRTTPQKAPSRVVLELSRLLIKPVEDCLTIQDVHNYPQNKNGYTSEYLALMHDFYLYA